MTADPLRPALERFAVDLTVAGEPVVLDQAVKHHLATFQTAIASGLRWPAVARLLKQIGARRADGKDLTSDQLRASFSRAERRALSHATGGPAASHLRHEEALREMASVPSHGRATSEIGRAAATVSSEPSPWQSAQTSQPVRVTQSGALAAEDDLTDADVHAARLRLSRL